MDTRSIEKGMKEKIITLILLMLLPLVAKAQPDPHFLIYLCIGQSNMVGAPPVESQDSCHVSDRFLNMPAVECGEREIGKWIKAVPPITNCSSGLCPADYFGRTMLEHLPEGYRVGVINVAVDGCTLTLFDKDQCRSVVKAMTKDWQINEVRRYDNNPYRRLIRCARKAQRDGVIAGILLQQGESDAYTSQWYNVLNKIYKNLCHDLLLRDVPLLVGETLKTGVAARANEIIDHVEEHVPNAHLVRSDGCTAYAGDGMNVHFDAVGQRLLGKRHALKMLELMGIHVGE